MDPGFTQINIAKNPVYRNAIDHADRFFTVGLRAGHGDCRIPTLGYQWHPTLPPVVLSEWPVVSNPNGCFTTVMRWRGFRDEVYENEEYGQKDKEFPKFIDLPKLTKHPLLLAAVGNPDIAEHGWNVVDGHEASRSPEIYREFIQSSKGEFSVAKNCYVKMRSGWFSDRSSCYLASGKPVILQDTALADCIPTGSGIVLFHDLPSAVQAIEDVADNYSRHAADARKLAEEHLATEYVLPKFIERSMA